MAEVCSCDLCGKSPANRVEVGIALWGVAVPDAPTGSSECVDACPECQEPATDALIEHLRGTLRDQVPFHVELQQNTVALDALQEPLQRVSAAVREHEAAHASKPEGDRPDLPKKVRDTHASLTLQAAELETARADLIGEAQKLHDKRVKKFRDSLSKK